MKKGLFPLADPAAYMDQWKANFRQEHVPPGSTKSFPGLVTLSQQYPKDKVERNFHLNTST
jgi:hypothetical protein